MSKDVFVQSGGGGAIFVIDHIIIREFRQSGPSQES